MITPGIQSSQGVVETECEYTEGSVGLVRAAVCERGPPEVVVEELADWSAWQKVLVRFDGSTENKNGKKINKFIL